MISPALTVEAWPLTRLRGYPKNAREHSPEQIRQIADSIRAFGWTNPLLVAPDGELIAGHGRLAAAQFLALSEAPCIVLAGLTDQQRRVLRLADNKLALNASWDAQMLAAELGELKLTDADLRLTGFDASELNAFESMFAPSSADEQGRLDQKKPVTCPACGAEFVPKG